MPGSTCLPESTKAQLLPLAPVQFTEPLIAIPIAVDCPKSVAGISTVVFGGIDIQIAQNSIPGDMPAVGTVIEVLVEVMIPDNSVVGVASCALTRGGSKSILEITNRARYHENFIIVSLPRSFMEMVYVQYGRSTFAPESGEWSGHADLRHMKLPSKKVFTSFHFRNDG